MASSWTFSPVSGGMNIMTTFKGKEQQNYLEEPKDLHFQGGALKMHELRVVRRSRELPETSGTSVVAIAAPFGAVALR